MNIIFEKMYLSVKCQLCIEIKFRSVLNECLLINSMPMVNKQLNRQEFSYVQTVILFSLFQLSACNYIRYVLHLRFIDFIYLLIKY